MYNKTQYQKSNDKKILHKVKKQWVVVTLSLLMMIGGGVLATHTTVSANNNTPNITINKNNNRNQYIQNNNITNNAKTLHQKLFNNYVKHSFTNPQTYNKQNNDLRLGSYRHHTRKNANILHNYYKRSNNNKLLKRSGYVNGTKYGGKFIFNKYAPNDKRAVIPKRLNLKYFNWAMGNINRNRFNFTLFAHKYNGWIKLNNRNARKYNATLKRIYKHYKYSQKHYTHKKYKKVTINNHKHYKTSYRVNKYRRHQLRHRRYNKKRYALKRNKRAIKKNRKPYKNVHKSKHQLKHYKHINKSNYNSSNNNSNENNTNNISNTQQSVTPQSDNQNSNNVTNNQNTNVTNSNNNTHNTYSDHILNGSTVLDASSDYHVKYTSGFNLVSPDHPEQVLSDSNNTTPVQYLGKRINYKGYPFELVKDSDNDDLWVYSPDIIKSSDSSKNAYSDSNAPDALYSLESVINPADWNRKLVDYNHRVSMEKQKCSQYVSQIKSELIKDINDRLNSQRKSKGEPTLTEDPQLDNLAMTHATKLAKAEDIINNLNDNSSTAQQLRQENQESGSFKINGKIASDIRDSDTSNLGDYNDYSEFLAGDGFHCLNNGRSTIDDCIGSDQDHTSDGYNWGDEVYSNWGSISDMTDPSDMSFGVGVTYPHSSYDDDPNNKLENVADDEKITKKSADGLNVGPYNDPDIMVCIIFKGKIIESNS